MCGQVLSRFLGTVSIALRINNFLFYDPLDTRVLLYTGFVYFFFVYPKEKVSKRKVSRSLGPGYGATLSCSHRTGGVEKSFHSVESLFSSLRSVFRGTARLHEMALTTRIVYYGSVLI